MTSRTSMRKPPAQKGGAGWPGRCPVGCFFWCSQRSVLVLCKRQMRKALGNERAARGRPGHATQQPGVGRGVQTCGDGLASPIKQSWSQDTDGVSSPSCSQKGDTAGSGCVWSLRGGKGTGRWEPQKQPCLFHFQKEASCRGFAQRQVSNK